MRLQHCSGLWQVQKKWTADRTADRTADSRTSDGSCRPQALLIYRRCESHTPPQCRQISAVPASDPAAALWSCWAARAFLG